jgi:hypothetical protein
LNIENTLDDEIKMEAPLEDKIIKLYESHRDMLIEKNRRYGNSATNPKKIFYKGEASDSILVRLNDKISRIENSDKLRKNDISDLIGYLMLYCISVDWLDFKDQVD